MSVVASAAIVSQLLPAGTVIANAQTNGSVNTQSTNQVKAFENEIQIFDMEGTEGLKIKFDNLNNKLNTEFLSKDMNNNDKKKDKTFSNPEDEDYNKVCINIRIYDSFDESKGKPGRVLRDFKYKGNDKISKAVSDLNHYEFKHGQCMRIVHRSKKDSRVKISGFVRNEAGKWDNGIDIQILSSSTLVNRGSWLEKKQDRNWKGIDYTSEYLDK